MHFLALSGPLLVWGLKQEQPMPRNYSVDLRSRIWDACQQGQRPCEAARHFKVSERCVYYLLSHVRKTGSVEPRVGKTGPKPKLEAHHEQLRELLRKHPDLTLEALREKLSVDVCLATLSNALRNLGLTLKKSPARRRAAPSRRGSTPRRVVQ